MKKTLVRLLSVILAAVMIFPAAAFADGEDYTLYYDSSTRNTQQLTYEGEEDQAYEWRSADTSVVTVSQDGLVTAVGAGSTYVEVKEKGSPSQLQYWTFGVQGRSVVNLTVSSQPTKTSYVSGAKFDPAGLELEATYNTNEKETIKSGYTYKTEPLSAADSGEFPISFGGKVTTVPITVTEKNVTSVKITDTRSEYEVGDLITDVKVLVVYNDGTTIDVLGGNGDCIITLNGDGTANRKLMTTDKSYEVTYGGKSDSKKITVKDKPSEGGGSGGGSGSGSGGSGDTTTGDYKLEYYTGPTKKTYTVGEEFDISGLYITVKDAKGASVAILSKTSNTSTLEALPYVFTDTDISPTTGTKKTTTITISVAYKEKLYPVSIPDLTVTAPKNTLKLQVSNGIIKNFDIELYRNAYPVGYTFTLNDIKYLGGLDENGKPFTLNTAMLDNYSNHFSLEVAGYRTSSSSSTPTTYQKSSYKSRIDSGDVYTKTNDQKVVFLRFYVDTDYIEFEYASGDSGVTVYYGTTALDVYTDLADALEDVNDLDFKWGGTSGRAYTDSVKLTIKLGEDASTDRYYIIPLRNIDIDLNGHNLTMYTDSFRFRDKYDKFSVVITNTATATSKVTYKDMTVKDLLIDRNEKITFKYQDASDTTIPGIYTVTVAEIKEGGSVSAEPAVSAKNTVTIAHGNDITFTVTPAKDFQIDTVKSKAGTSAEQTVSVSTNKEYSVSANTGVATYTMKDIKADTILTAAFKAVKKEEEKKEEKPADTPWTNPFTDVRSTASYYDAVKYVNQNGLMDGMTTTSFGPDRTMTRAQFVTVLGRMFLGSLGVPNLETTNQKYESMLGTYGTISQFTDVSNDDPTLKNWAVPYIIWAEKEGLVQGLGNGKFDPQGPITHQQMYIIMYRYAQYIAHQSINAATLPDLRATDANKIGEGWLSAAKEGAIAAAKYAQQQNFLVSTVVIDPAGFAVRSELATLLMQFSKNVLGWN
jgi:hypothetical protein